MGNALELNDANFHAEVIQSDKPVLVDFSATWCGPCRLLAPVVDQLAKDYAGRVKVCKVDIDQAQESAGKYGIMSVPTVLIFKGGTKVDTIIGNNKAEVYKAKLDSLIA